MARGKRWTRDEVLLALHLYERIPFGQQDSRNPEVMALAERLSRTSSSVSMKLNNLTSLDPEEKARGVKGLEGASQLDRAVWDEFHRLPDVVEEAEALWEGWTYDRPAPSTSTEPAWQGATEGRAIQKVRLAQNYFRRVVLVNFNTRCALTGLAVPDLLTASHIVEWSKAPDLRVSPGNGLCLNRLHDGAFDRGLVTFDDELRLVLGKRIRHELGRGEFSESFLPYEGKRLAEPARHQISRELLARHRREFERREAA